MDKDTQIMSLTTKIDKILDVLERYEIDEDYQDDASYLGDIKRILQET